MVFHLPIKGSLEAKQEKLMLINTKKREEPDFEFINRLTPNKIREKIPTTIKA